MLSAFADLVLLDSESSKMRLAAFIRADAPQIAKEWEAFALKLIPAAAGMSPLALRNHLKEILEFIVADIDSAQTESEQIKKSHGEKSNNAEHGAAEIHAALREAGGFDLDQMVSEYRALRASVIRLWEAQQTELNSEDIRDLIRFNEAIDQACTESIHYYSKKLDVSRSLFLQILSHDLKNPIGAVRTASQLALKVGAPNERQTILLFQIMESADRASEIVSHLLDLTRARLGSGLPVIKEHMDMGFTCKKLIEEMRAMHPYRTFTLEISGDTEGEWDRARIGQVFSNLLSNAVQYSFKDSPIVVTIEGASDEVLLSVHNDGAPISPKSLERIFDSLTRGVGEPENNNHPGSLNLGLGLYITREIMAAHGGTVGVKSSEKEGTTFTARFPRLH